MPAEIGCYATTTSTAATVKLYELTYSTLSKETVHGFTKAYLKEKETTNKEATVLKSRKRGRPKLLLEDHQKYQSSPKISCKQYCHYCYSNG